MTEWHSNFRTCLRLSGSIVILFLIPFLAGAEQAQNTASVKQGADQRIVNGLATFDHSTTVAIISPPPGADFSSVPACSGVLIGCDTVLSAAHCFCFDPDNAENPEVNGAACQPGGPFLQPASDFAVAAQNETIIDVASIQIPQNYQFGVAADIAVLKLARPVNGISPARINSIQRPALGSYGLTIGYGATQADTQGIGMKRAGQIVTNTCTLSSFDIPDDEHLCWSYTTPAGEAGADSSTCIGDFGGPLFIDLGAGPVVAGITSGASSACEGDNIPWNSDVFVNRSFIEAAAGADINSSSCGILPQVGTTDTTVIAQSGEFGQPGDEDFDFHTVEVPPGTSLMRITLNGEVGVPVPGSFNDFDLFARFNVPPTVDDANCGSFSAGNFEACEFSNPIPGTWHIMVRRFQGLGGRYQLTTTLFDQNLSPAPSESRLFNISTNAIADENGITAGFIVSGNGALRLVFTGESIPARRTLGDAFIELIDMTSGTVLMSNDNWQDEASADEVVAAIGREPANPGDAAFAHTVPPGPYLLRLTDVGGSSGRGLVSVTEAPGQSGATYLANISTNAIADEKGIVGGFILAGSSAKRLVYTGESIAPGPALDNAYLDLLDFYSGSILRANDNWGSDPSADEVVVGIGREPASPGDGAFAHTVPPGAYLLKLRDAGSATGRGLIGVTEAP